MYDSVAVYDTDYYDATFHAASAAAAAASSLAATLSAAFAVSAGLASASGFGASAKATFGVGAGLTSVSTLTAEPITDVYRSADFVAASTLSANAAATFGVGISPSAASAISAAATATFGPAHAYNAATAFGATMPKLVFAIDVALDAAATMAADGTHVPFTPGTLIPDIERTVAVRLHTHGRWDRRTDGNTYDFVGVEEEYRVAYVPASYQTPQHQFRTAYVTVENRTAFVARDMTPKRVGYAEE